MSVQFYSLQAIPEGIMCRLTDLKRHVFRKYAYGTYRSTV